MPLADRGMWLDKIFAAIRDLRRLRKPCWGRVAEVDLTGEAEGNDHKITPAYRVDIFRLGIRRSVWCAGLRRNAGDGWGEWWPLQEGARVLVAFRHPGTELYPVIIGTIWLHHARNAVQIPDEATEDKRVIKTPDGSLFIMDYRAGRSRIYLKTPDGHSVHLGDTETAGGDKAEIRSADGKYLALDDDADKVSLVHQIGAWLEIDSEGTITLHAKKDAVIEAEGDVRVSAGGDIAAEAGGDITLDADGDVEVDADGDVEVNADGDVTVDSEGTVTIEAAEAIRLRTAGGLTAGVVTGLTQPVCQVTGAPIGCSTGVEAS